MSDLCTELITSVVVLPITAGNYRRRQNGSMFYDGSISSIVFTIVFLSIIIVFSLSKDINIGEDERLAIVFVLLSFIMIFGMLGCLALGFVIRKRGLDHVVSSKRQGSVTKVQLMFLWIFGILSGLFSAFLVGQQIQCQDFSQYIVGNGGFFWDSKCFFNVITIIFLFVEVIFISYFVQFHLRRSTSVRYVLFVLVSANVSVWLHSVIVDNEPFPESILDKQFGNNSMIPCLQNKTFGKIINNSKQIFKPCFLEFCLLSTTMLFEMWGPVIIQASEEENPNNENMMVSVNRVIETERTALLENEGIETGSAGRRHSRTVYQLVSFFISIIIGLALIIIYVIWVHNLEKSDIRLTTDRYYTGINTAMILAVLVGFYCLVHNCTPGRTPKPLKVSEYVYLLSTSGIVMLHVCEILSGISTISNISYILSIVQDYLQVVFLLHANRCRKSITNSPVHLLDCVLIFLIILNLSIWVSDSFVIEQYLAIKTTEQDILGEDLWSLYHNVLLPVSVFYRFSSALEMFATFKLHSARY